MKTINVEGCKKKPIAEMLTKLGLVWTYLVVYSAYVFCSRETETCWDIVSWILCSICVRHPIFFLPLPLLLCMLTSCRHWIEQGPLITIEQVDKQDWKVFQSHRLHNKWQILQMYVNSTSAWWLLNNCKKRQGMHFIHYEKKFTKLASFGIN